MQGYAAGSGVLSYLAAHDHAAGLLVHDNLVVYHEHL